MPSSLDLLESFIPERDRTDPDVSAWSVGMQIHHALLATRGISRALLDSTPGAKKRTFSFPRSIVLLTGRIPRGRGKAPRSSLPSAAISEAELRELVDSARDALARAERAPPRSWWEHGFFGVMYRDAAIRFVHVHNRHHARIAAEILKRTRRVGAARD